ncbi:putative ABC transporter ATP-binding protein YknY [Methanosarcinales archaeon]|nr:ABC transporter ATP-binding protein [Candidatus Methanoperedens sp. BLZ2]MCX9078416.1 ABC transporter ATP-binding protein [Candidatus Methanoperedens sp.]MCX9089190.1 ABC transporter ATP-binding protein [Candidatus Methanoperedens sp.]CAG0976655.1 putative ABC transporter ATP-binding protein YknY [Methanosarcinales archaeon]
MIIAKNLVKKYDTTCALKDASFTIEKGEWANIMGPSGSGKTTLLNLIGCLDSPTSGSLLVNGIETTKLSQKERTRFRRENIGLVFQQFHMIPHLTALENVMIAQYFHSIEDEKEAKEALVHVGMEHRLHHLPSQLSGGEQQRVCIARALINQPRIILADEPTGNLDKTNEEAVLDIFRKLHSEGRTIVIVTHNPEIGEIGDKIIQISHGEVKY